MFEIRWHWHDEKKCPTPVFSVDVTPYDDIAWRLATAGGDNTVKMWRVSHGEGETTDVQFLAELSRHTAAVNCVRFSPDGSKLASGGDDNTIMVWALESSAATDSSGDLTPLDDIGSVEKWRIVSILRRHSEDVYDLAWSPDSTQLISGSVDKTCVIWDVSTGAVLDHLREHQHFVQGVAWHPQSTCVASQSCDRSCVVTALTLDTKAGGKAPRYTAGKLLAKNTRRLNQKFRCEHDDSGTAKLSELLYVDESKTSFFRRLCFTPDGSLMISPAGRFTNKAGDDTDTLFVYKTAAPNTPIARLSGLPSTVVAIRCCPVLFELRDCPAVDGSDTPFKGLDHRVIFAVATSTMVLLYDTQQMAPFGGLANLHFAAITDLAWSGDGRILVISSSDGFCSIVSFTETDLGTAVAAVSAPKVTQTISSATPSIAKIFKPANAFNDSDATPASPMSTNTTSSEVGLSSGGEATGRPAKQRRITPQLVAQTSKDGGQVSSAPRRIAPTPVAPASTAQLVAPGPRRVVPTLVTPSDTPMTKQIQPTPTNSSGDAPRRITPTLIASASNGM